MTDYVHGSGLDQAQATDHGAEDAPDGAEEAADASENGDGEQGGSGHDDRRTHLIAAAQAGWIDALTDLGGRNTLLYYKDRRAGTLDLGAADPTVLDRFLRTGSARLTRLFHDVDARADAIRRVQVIYRKARELQEERGIRVGFLAVGMARWDELFLEPCAPVLLRGLTINPTRARHDDFDLVLDDDYELNPVLLHKLASAFGAATDDLAKADPDKIEELLARAAGDAEVPGFRITNRMVVGTFTYAKLPMVQDLQVAGELLGDSDVVAAIAGDSEAQESLRADDSAPQAVDSPERDYSVLDADSSQRNAIDAVLAGRSLVIHGPPGTGKSQTIANLIAALVARGRKVLFVAEKRAAIDAVLSRLKGASLGEVVLDIHEGTKDRVRIARELGDALDEAQRTPEPDVGDLHRRLTDRHKRLARHVSALHQLHQPWGLTPFQVQSALLGVPAEARVNVRLANPEQIGKEQADRIRDEIREFAHLGGFALRPGTTPWFGARLRDREDARRACELAVRLSSRSLPLLLDRVAKAAAEVGLRPPRAYPDAAAVMLLLASVQATARLFGVSVYAADPARLAAATSDGAGLNFRERRALRKQARALAGAGALASGRSGPTGELTDQQLSAVLSTAAGELREWLELRTDGGLPRLPRHMPELVTLFADCQGQLDALGEVVSLPADPAPLLAELAADQDTAWRLPRLYELANTFGDLYLGALIDELARREAGPDLAAGAFEHAWYSAILDHMRVLDPRYAADRGDALDEIAGDFRVHDVEHLVANRARVRRAWAESLLEACDHHPLQARVVRKQAALRRRHLPLRRLLDQASDILFAIKPCWAMSPLMVSQVLPAARVFDVVIFDEASQIVPADAIPAIMRGHQIVVAGDDRQLPPTNFFRQVGDPDDDGDEEDETFVSFGAGFESVLDALRPLLPTAPLTWHYRSRDERLVAFSNSRIYGGALTTFPGVLRDDCLRHVVVAQGPGSGQETSVDAEVEKVVALILEHARNHPAESLGVIALGIKHAERIDAALRTALANLSVLASHQEPDRPSGLPAVAHRDNDRLEAFFAEDVSEPFFVKNLERVQGDERDAIILSIGYGKHPDGRMRYQWGPLLRDGGERRLNVAATRAKHRLTLVSSFSGHDVDPDRVRKAGARMLADYLEYASSGGSAQEATGAAELDSFEADVRDRLAAAGITVVPQYGVGGYRVDFAAMHPEDPGRMVLAIEADGATYWQSGSVRDRDRLRGEHLQRLGWRYHRLWSTNWFGDPDAEVAKVRDAYSRAVSRPGSRPAPGAGDESPSGADTSAGASQGSQGAGSAGPSRAGATDITSRSLVPATRDLAPATRDLAPATRDLAPVPMQTNQVAPMGDSGES
ncbi:MAG TPA: AAA domain-containing protein [Streptosporangiaceae bacterium]|nr:AAA domain-containing protein [Streptosporangiaceae bacterium]